MPPMLIPMMCTFCHFKSSKTAKASCAIRWVVQRISPGGYPEYPVPRLSTAQTCGKIEAVKFTDKNPIGWIPSLKLTGHSTWKWWFPIGISFSRGLFSGDMLVSGRIFKTNTSFCWGIGFESSPHFETHPLTLINLSNTCICCGVIWKLDWSDVSPEGILRTSHPPLFLPTVGRPGKIAASTQTETSTNHECHPNPSTTSPAKLGHGVWGGEITYWYPSPRATRNSDFVIPKFGVSNFIIPTLSNNCLHKRQMSLHLRSIFQRTGLRLRKTPIINPRWRVGFFFP